MRKLAIISTALLLAASAFLVGPFLYRQLRTPINPSAVPTIGPGERLVTFPEPVEGTPEPNPKLTVEAAISDAITGKRLVAKSVVLGGKVIAEQVTEFEFTLPGQVLEEITLEVFAPGYERWAVALRFNLMHSRTYALPIRLNPSPSSTPGD